MEQNTSMCFRGLSPFFPPPREKPASGTAQGLAAPNGATVSCSVASQTHPAAEKNLRMRADSKRGEGAAAWLMQGWGPSPVRSGLASKTTASPGSGPLDRGASGPGVCNSNTGLTQPPPVFYVEVYLDRGPCRVHGCFAFEIQS